jgi:hypothetical protein
MKFLPGLMIIAALVSILWFYNQWQHERYENELVVVYGDGELEEAYDFTPGSVGGAPETGDPLQIAKDGRRFMYRWQFEKDR